MISELSAIEEQYRTDSPRSRVLYERARAVMPAGAKGAYFYKPFPLTMERGEGCYLFDVDERRFVDFAGHHTAQVLGNNHPEVGAAVRAQLERGIVFGAPTGVETALAEELCTRVASLERVRFCNSGTEATLHAIRLARGFTRRPKLAKFEGAYHGSHDAVEISVAPPLALAGAPDAPIAVPSAGGISPHAAAEVVILPYDNEAAVERLIRAHRDELACVIFDPKAGILPQRRAFVQHLREVTRQHGVLLICDEVVGFRVERGGIQAHFGISPDLSTFGKLIGGGFPVGAFGGRADIMDLLDNSQGSTGFFQSGTFSAHPLAMAAGLATLRALTPQAFAHLDRLGTRLRDGLNALFAREQTAAQAVGIASLFSIHFSREAICDYRALARADKQIAQRVFLSLLSQGYFLSSGLAMSAVSLPMTDEHIDGLIAAVGHALAAVGE